MFIWIEIGKAEVWATGTLKPIYYSCTAAIRNELKNCASLVLHCIVCIVYRWKNHFFEMKGDVGMSRQKEGNKKMPTQRQIASHSSPHPYIFVSFSSCMYTCGCYEVFVLFSLPDAFMTSKTFLRKASCRDGIMNDQLSVLV